ncbi:MAG TPA: hypothetical protein VHK05_02985 [Candidatus Limnocylindrales bacterium]|jgi:hypothetical protein|nr:hypothetical protein [Candidatus Limnocylindrales bacterium]
MAQTRLRRYGAHFIIHGLELRSSLSVGPATIRPARVGTERFRRHAASWPPEIVERYGELFDVPGTAIVELDVRTTSTDHKEILERAREGARDVIAVLRLFQRSRFVLDLEREVFGLVEEVPSYSDTGWLTHSARLLFVSGRRLGTLGPFEFGPADLRAFRSDLRFRYLAAALATPSRNDLQRRVLQGVRLVHAAQEAFRPGTRVALYATAIEVMLGRKNEVGSHRFLKRVAFIQCVEGMPRHSDVRPACVYLTAPSGDDVETLKQQARQYCWAYELPKDVYKARNSALHRGREDFPHLRRYLNRVDELILSTVDWIKETGATTLAELDRAIAAVPAA